MAARRMEVAGLSLSDDLEMDENGILRGPDGSDFILDENGILRVAPNGRDSGINSTPTHVSYRSNFNDFDDSFRIEIATPSSASDSNRGGPAVELSPDCSQDVEDWPAQSPRGILKRVAKRSTPPNTHLNQDIDYYGSVPNNTQEFFRTPVQSQNSLNSERDEDNITPIEDQLHKQYRKSSSSETQEEREDLHQALRHEIDELTTVESNRERLDAVETAAEITLSEDDVAHLDLNELERYAEAEVQNGREYLSDDSHNSRSPLEAIYLKTKKDEYIFKDDLKEVDQPANSLRQAAKVDDDMEVSIMDEEMPVLTGASIPLGDSCEEVVGSEALMQQHLRDAMATKNDALLITDGDIPHSLIELEALEVQMQIQNQLAQLTEEEDVLGDFLRSTERTPPEKATAEFNLFARANSVPLDSKPESEDWKNAARNSGDSPSRIPVAKKRSLTKGGSLRSSTDSLNSNAPVSKISARKPPSPAGSRGRLTPQKKDSRQTPVVKKSTLTLKEPRSHTSTPQNSTAKTATSTKKDLKPMKAQKDVPALELVDSMDDSDIETVRSKLRSKLASEQSKRKQQQDVIKQLQEDYDHLLTKFALAEVTIDQLRLGAKMNLYSDSPTPQTVGQVQQSQQIQYAQPLTFGTRNQGQAGIMGQGRSRGQQGVQNDFQGSRPHSRDSLDGLTPLSFQDYDEPAKFEDDFGGSKGESIKIGLLFQARSLSDQMESFQMLLDEDELNTEEQEKVIDKVKTDYDKLQADYRQAKHDSLLMKQHNLIDQDGGDGEFDSDKVIEGELFRLGMKLDDLQQNVEENMRIAKRRTPFQDIARPYQNRAPSGGGYQNSSAVDESSTTDLENDPLDTKWQKLLKDYNALLDLFDRLKRLPKTPEREKDIAALMKKLKYLHAQSPNLLQPLPKMPDSDEETLEGSMFGSASSVVRATSKNSVANSDLSSARPDRRRNDHVRADASAQKTASSSSAAVTGTGDASSDRYQRRSRSGYQESEGDRVDRRSVGERSPKVPRPTSASRARATSESSKKDTSEKELSLERGRRPRKSETDDGQTTMESSPSQKASVRPVELDRDSGFIGSESSRQSQPNVSKRAQNMSTLTDEDENTQYPYKPSTTAAPPPHTWTDSELSSTVVEKAASRLGQRNPKRSTTSLVSDSVIRARKPARNNEQSHRRGRTREESETEGISTARASVKSEKIKTLESEVEKLKELIQKQAEETQKVAEVIQEQTPKLKNPPDAQPWQHSYPWIEEQRRYSLRDGGKMHAFDPRRYHSNRPQTWEDFPYHSTRRRHSPAESEIPSIDTMEVASQSQPRRRSLTPDRRSYERRINDKNRYNEQARISPPRVPRPRDLDRHGEREERDLESRDRRTANREPRSRSVPRLLDYNDSPVRASRDVDDSRRNSDYPKYVGRTRDRYGSFDDLARDDDDDSRHEEDDRLRRVASPELEAYHDHEKRYRFFRDLEKGRQHIQKVLETAAENKRKQDEKERKERRRQPVIIQGPGTLTKTVTGCCPMCKGSGECTHTEIYHLPQMHGHLGMQFTGMSEIHVSNGDIGDSVQRSVMAGVQPVPGLQPPGGVVPNFGQPPAVVLSTPNMAHAPAYVPATPQAQYPAPMVAPSQQPITSTPYIGGDVRSQSDDSGPVIKIPLRLYENKLNTRYMVKEYGVGDSSAQSRSKSKSRSSSVPPKDSARSKSSRYTDDSALYGMSGYEKYDRIRGGRMNDSLDEAVRLAASLNKLSGKMKNDVKDDLRRSVRTEHFWKTTSTTSKT